jgi:hypothetical protein
MKGLSALVASPSSQLESLEIVFGDVDSQLGFDWVRDFSAAIAKNTKLTEINFTKNDDLSITVDTSSIRKALEMKHASLCLTKFRFFNISFMGKSSDYLNENFLKSIKTTAPAPSQPPPPEEISKRTCKLIFCGTGSPLSIPSCCK